MALSKQRKIEIVAETANLLSGSKLTVFARYPGTSVKSLQQLRKASRESGTTVRIVKNRLFRLAASQNEAFKGTDLGAVEGQLLYAFNSGDEVAPAQELAKFAVNEPQIEFVGAITADGQILEAADVKALALLPGKNELRSKLAGTIAAPLRGVLNVTAGNLRGVVGVLSARAQSSK